MNRLRLPATLVLAAALASGAPFAQAPAIKRTLLQRTDVGGNLEVVLGLAEIAKGGSTGRHTHFGAETGYVIEGTSTLEVEGEAPKTLKAGDSYLIPAGKVHNAIATGEGTTRVLATYVVEKGKPLASPVD